MIALQALPRSKCIHPTCRSPNLVQHPMDMPSPRDTVDNNACFVDSIQAFRSICQFIILVKNNLARAIPAIFSGFALKYMFLWFLLVFSGYMFWITEAMASRMPSRHKSFDNNRVQIMEYELAVDCVKVSYSTWYGEKALNVHDLLDRSEI